MSLTITADKKFVVLEHTASKNGRVEIPEDEVELLIGALVLMVESLKLRITEVSTPSAAVREHRGDVTISTDDDSSIVWVPLDGVPDLVDALRAVTGKAPQCDYCGSLATRTIELLDDADDEPPVPYCDKHGAIFTPIEIIRKVTI